jgi:hypothetical protein
MRIRRFWVTACITGSLSALGLAMSHFSTGTASATVYCGPINPGAGQVAIGEWFIPSLGVRVVITGPDTDQIGRMLRRS